jgi:predicted nucleotidyltransferase
VVSPDPEGSSLDDSYHVELTEHVALRLGHIEGVVAVALGGSLARHEAYPDSDVDLGIYYRPDAPPSVKEIRRLAEELDDRHPQDAATHLGEWGPWINGGAWLRTGGQRVDRLYRDLDRVEEVFAECRAGRQSCYYQPGHPHGFHNHIYMGEVHFCRPLFDPENELVALKGQTAEYPFRLRSAIVEKYLWEAQFALDTGGKSADRDDVFYVGGCAFRCVACLVQVLFALNGRYFVNEKGSVETVETFSLKPPDFGEVVETVMGGTGRFSADLKVSMERLGVLVAEVRALCFYSDLIGD